MLDAEEDVIRDLEIKGDQPLETLHRAIVEAFALPQGEMASFYESNRNWEQGDEIPLVDMGLSGQKARDMRTLTIDEVGNSISKQLLYVYDFLAMWTFFVEWVSERSIAPTDPTAQLVFSVGQRPLDPPEKDFSGDDYPEKGLFDDAFDEDDMDEEGLDHDDRW